MTKLNSDFQIGKLTNKKYFFNRYNFKINSMNLFGTRYPSYPKFFVWPVQGTHEYLKFLPCTRYVLAKFYSRCTRLLLIYQFSNWHKAHLAHGRSLTYFIIMGATKKMCIFFKWKMVQKILC